MQTNENKYDLTFFDLLLILISIFGFVIILFIFTQLLHVSNSNARLLFVYFGSTLSIIVPAFYARLKKKNYFNQIVFLNRSKGFDRNWLIGIASGLVLVTIFRLTPYWDLLNPLIHIVPKREMKWFNFLFFPITILGFQDVVLGPIGEEVIHRGIIFNYLKCRMNLWIALFIQAFVAAIFHVNAITSTNAVYFLIYFVLIEFVLGVLYEKTNYLIASILSHGTFNYLILVFSYYWK